MNSVKGFQDTLPDTSHRRPHPADKALHTQTAALSPAWKPKKARKESIVKKVNGFYINTG